MNPFSVHVNGATRSSQHRRSMSTTTTTTVVPNPASTPSAAAATTAATTTTLTSSANISFSAPISSSGNGRISTTHQQHSFSLDTLPVSSTSTSSSLSPSLKNSTHSDILIKPARAALTLRPFPRSIPLTFDEESFPCTPKKTHQRSLSALLPVGIPKSSLPPSTSSSPKKETSSSSYFMPFTGDKAPKRLQKSDATAGWFSGTSAPIPLGVSNNDDDMATMEDSASIRSHHGRKQSIASISQSTTTTGTSSAPTSRFNFFTKAPTTRTVTLPASDPFANIDIQSALFPSGPPSDRDPFSPSSFKNLLMNAEGLLNKLQSAYVERTASFTTLKAEYEAQADELEEAETRAAHLKQQLEDMAKRVSEQDEAMVKLVQDTAAEKAERRERETLTCVVVRGPTPTSPEAGSEADEDLDVRRASAMSDASFDSDGEESIFSRARSPTNVSDMSIFAPPPVPPKDDVNVKPISVVGRVFGVGAAKTVSECRNCRGGDARFAWDAVKMLRTENKGLKERVTSLEGAVEGVLDLVR